MCACRHAEVDACVHVRVDACVHVRVDACASGRMRACMSDRLHVILDIGQCNGEDGDGSFLQKHDGQSSLGAAYCHYDELLLMFLSTGVALINKWSLLADFTNNQQNMACPAYAYSHTYSAYW